MSAPKLNKPGSTRTVTRASRRIIQPALTPGSLKSAAATKGISPARYIADYLLRPLCDQYLRGAPMPLFEARTSKMDRWLQAQLHEDRTGFLPAFIDQAAMIQSNRHWRITGPSTVVHRTTQMLHMSDGGAPDGGFRSFLRRTALNYYSSNAGGRVYLHRPDPASAIYLPDKDAWDWHAPPVTQMFSTDSTLFVPRPNDYLYPAEYNEQPLLRYDYFSTVAMPSTILATWGVGRSALYRNIQVARMTSAIYDHIYNAVSPDTTKGILTIRGMTGEEFLDALQGSDGVNERDIVADGGRNPAAPMDDLGDLIVLADRDNEITVRFVTLGRMPEGFFLDQWINRTLTSFAVNLGFPLEEFTGSPASRLLGQSGAEVEAGQFRGATKGGADFINQLQEYLQQMVLGHSIHFEFSERDEQGEINDLTILERKLTMMGELFERTQPTIVDRNIETQDTLLEARAKGEHIITRDEARRWLVELGAPTWLYDQGGFGDASIDDSYGGIAETPLRLARERAKSLPFWRNVADAKDPIVQYESWVDRNDLVRERELVLWRDGDEMVRPTIFAVPEVRPLVTGIAPGMVRRGSAATLDAALKSGHARALRQAGRDRETLTTRLYAIAQLGAWNVIGRRKTDEGFVSSLAGELYDFATGYVTNLLADKPVSSQEDAKGTWADVVLAGVAEENYSGFMDDAICRAFAAGQQVAAERMKLDNKTWMGGCLDHMIDGETVYLRGAFSHGEKWPGLLPACRCSVRFN